LRKENPYTRLEDLGVKLESGIRKIGAPVQFNRVGSMFTLFFTNQPVRDFDSAKACDTARFNRFFHSMLEQGIYLPPSQFEAAFISAAHTGPDIERTVAAIENALSGI